MHLICAQRTFIIKVKCWVLINNRILPLMCWNFFYGVLFCVRNWCVQLLIFLFQFGWMKNWFLCAGCNKKEMKLHDHVYFLIFRKKCLIESILGKMFFDKNVFFVFCCFTFYNIKHTYRLLMMFVDYILFFSRKFWN